MITKLFSAIFNDVFSRRYGGEDDCMLSEGTPPCYPPACFMFAHAVNNPRAAMVLQQHRLSRGGVQ